MKYKNKESRRKEWIAVEGERKAGRFWRSGVGECGQRAACVAVQFLGIPGYAEGTNLEGKETSGMSSTFLLNWRPRGQGLGQRQSLGSKGEAPERWDPESGAPDCGSNSANAQLDLEPGIWAAGSNRTAESIITLLGLEPTPQEAEFSVWVQVNYWLKKYKHQKYKTHSMKKKKIKRKTNNKKMLFSTLFGRI